MEYPVRLILKKRLVGAGISLLDSVLVQILFKRRDYFVDFA
jgi:hypothetical protein